MFFGERLQIAREFHRTTREDLAGKLGVEPEVIERWEMGGFAPTEPMQKRIALLLQFPVTFFHRRLPEFGIDEVGNSLNWHFDKGGY